MNKFIFLLLVFTLIFTAMSFGHIWAQADLCAASFFVAALILTLLRVVNGSDNQVQ